MVDPQDDIFGLCEEYCPENQLILKCIIIIKKVIIKKVIIKKVIIKKVNIKKVIIKKVIIKKGNCQK